MVGDSRFASARPAKRVWFKSSLADEAQTMALVARRTQCAGKSTYAPKVRADVEEIVGPDEFAYRLVPVGPEQAALRAGRLAVQRRNELLREHRSFAVET